ncbi:MAG: hypothetical protein H5T73_11210 [Actinobacteria bacterium]|nr:hypothetical protein [Actinomycetota bacterium]
MSDVMSGQRTSTEGGSPAVGPAAEAGDASRAAQGALPGLVRELIRSPGFKELVNIHLRGADPASARELVRAFLWEDVGFSMGVLGASPKILNWLVEALIELGVQLNNFTKDILRDFMVRMGRDLDVERMKALPAAYAPMLNDLLLEDREALDALIAGLGSLAESMMKATGATLKKIGNTADFGKVRVGLTRHFESRREELSGEPPTLNPVVLSNLLGVVPPLTNYLLRVFTRALQGMNLPSEILASATFQLLEDIDQAELGGLVNALCDVVISLHRGNLLLGRDEPRFKQVLERVSGKLLDNVDAERFKEAAVALGEDGKVIGQVVSGYLFATPESTARVARAMSVAVNAALRATADLLRRFAELSPEAMEEVVSHYRETFDPREAARLLNTNAVILNKACAVAPELVGETVGGFMTALDREELARAGKSLALQAARAVLADPAVDAALQPEALGERINAGLAAFNRVVRENPDLVSRVARTIGAVDGKELRRATLGFAFPLIRALARETKAGKTAVRAGAGVLALLGAGGALLALRAWRRR